MLFNLNKNSKGFSLIELLIVIIIISLVYFLGFSSIEKVINKPKVLTPINLKHNIINSNIFQGKGTFLCINESKSCYFRRDIYSPFESYEDNIDLKGSTLYMLDNQDALQKMEYGRYQDEKISLVLNFYPNGSSTQTILEQGDKIYFIPAFFGETIEVKSLSEAKELWLKSNRSISSQGEFY